MTDREALLSAVLQTPDADLPRLVFADWLDEHGEHARAEFIRLGAGKSQPTRLSKAEGEWLDRVDRLAGPPQVLKLLPALCGLAAPHTSVLVSRKGRHVRVRVTVPDRSERGRTLRSCWVNLEYQRGFAVAARYSYAAAFLHTCRAVAQDEPLAVFEPITAGAVTRHDADGRLIATLDSSAWGDEVFRRLRGFDYEEPGIKEYRGDTPATDDPQGELVLHFAGTDRHLRERVASALRSAMTRVAREPTKDDTLG